MTFVEALSAARQLSATEKLRLIQILAKELETAAAISPLEPCKTYDLLTPYDCFGAGAVLMEALPRSESKQ